MKDLVFIYEVPIYEVHVSFVLTGDIKAAHAELKLKYVEDNCAKHGGETHEDEGAFYLFLNPSCLTHAFISHELAHVVHGICRFVGIRASFKNDEAEAHLLYNLTEYFYRELEKLELAVASKPTDEATSLPEGGREPACHA